MWVSKPTYKTSALELYTNSFQDDVVANKLLSLSRQKYKKYCKEITDGTVAELENGGKSVDDVVQIFQISTKETPFITKQKLDLVEEFIKLTGREQDLISILSKTFGGGKNLARILEHASTTKTMTKTIRR
ncbi:LOW QUALITY PROTEIN: RxLR effector protein [Phytophthora megakarya]|uniref:RxLR effector protein n=1 Tax=Phytophthora megakarya TaxID=4795 RepID=A0A225WD25_9STRA|nr:LOW QUALITY PROTEIN: RxLR effector protein [Phytophthora megakarya]